MKKDEIILMSIMVAIGIGFAVIALSVESIVAKWIWGILAIAIIGFAVYGTIEAIIKSRRKPKDFADFLIDFVKEQSQKPGFDVEISKHLEDSVQRRHLLFERQRPDEDDYGYSLHNPIMTSTIDTREKYLNSLRTFDGKPFTWVRNGSTHMQEVHGVNDVIVDEFQLFLNGQKYKKIYICRYGHSCAYVPKGMMLSE